MNEQKKEQSTFDKMIEFLDLTWEARNYIVPCLVGPPGIGKTEAVRKHAQTHGTGDVTTIIVSQILPNEVSGITIPDKDTKAMEIYDHFRLGHMKDGDILFFDELLEGEQYVLSACLTLIESRMMMSGKKLPDIQIVAATNETVMPTQLRPAIRQRFLWRSFKLDSEGCRQYILEETGIDIEDLKHYIEEQSSSFNVLTPRSMTKMAKWIVSAKAENEETIANIINDTWGSLLGTKLLEKKKHIQDENDKARQVAKDLRSVVEDVCLDEDLSSMFEDINDKGVEGLEVLMKKLQTMPQWNNIKEALENIKTEGENNAQES